MSTIRFIIVTIICIAMMATAAHSGDVDMPKAKVVKIKEPVTKLVIDILPGRGVKLIFPWIIDEKAKPSPARLVITNAAVFEQQRGEMQNSIEYKINSNARGESLEGELCDAFVTMEGFHFVFTLRVTFSKKRHYSTILFELGEAKKYELINAAIKKYREEKNSGLDQAGVDIDDIAKKHALKVIARTALSKPKKTNIYEKTTKKLENGDRIIFSADQVLTYGDIHILKIKVENDSLNQPLNISAVQIEKTSGNTQPLFCQHEIRQRIDNSDSAEGFIVTRDIRIIDRDDTKLKLITNRGEAVLEW